jgi:hypothetical protein
MITNDAGRARKGGETGMNGEFYKGGTFLPSTEAPKGTHTVSWRERDPLTPEQLAKIAQQEAEVAERKLKNAAIALEPHNAWLISWLAKFGEQAIRAFRPSIGWQRIYGEVPTDAIETEEFLDWTFCRSGFLADMYREVAEFGKRPVDLSDRQYQTLCDIYVKDHGARRGSKRWNALCEEFYDNTLPNEIEEEK